MAHVLKVGKLDNDTLKRVVIDRITYKNENVVVKAGVGEDCAYLDYGEDYCVLSTDPITASVADIGKLAIHISCNDVAATGVRPFALLLALMLPVGSTLEDVEHIMGQAADEANLLKVEIAGGHTEVTPAVNTPVIVATALGRAPKNKTLARGGITPGDHIVITKSAGLEGTSIIAKDYGDRLRDVLTPEELEEAMAMSERTDVIEEGSIAGDVGVSAMHDVTEGGVLGALWELCTIAGTGALVEEARIPVEDVTKKVCAKFGIDYLRLISSGAMLIIAPENKIRGLLDRLEEAGVPAVDIGIVSGSGAPIEMIRTDGERVTVAPPESDELYKVVGRE